MSRVSPLYLLVIGVSLAACDVQVRPPVIVEKQTVIVEEKKPPVIEVHVDKK